jgi:hypothetical protein
MLKIRDIHISVTAGTPAPVAVNAAKLNNATTQKVVFFVFM